MQALADGRIDVGPLDSYVFDLIRASDAAFAAQVKIIATTDATPMPAIVCSGSVDPDTLARLRAACLEASNAARLAGLRATLLIERFVVPDPGAYDHRDELERWAHSASGTVRMQWSWKEGTTRFLCDELGE